MTTYIGKTGLELRAVQLFPNNATYQNKWIANYLHLRDNVKKPILKSGGWLTDSGRFLPEFKHSVFNKDQLK